MDLASLANNKKQERCSEDAIRYKGHQVEILGDPNAPTLVTVDGKDRMVFWNPDNPKGKVEVARWIVCDLYCSPSVSELCAHRIIKPFGFLDCFSGLSLVRILLQSGYLPREQTHFQLQSCAFSSGSFERFQIQVQQR